MILLVHGAACDTPLCGIRSKNRPVLQVCLHCLSTGSSVSFAGDGITGGTGSVNCPESIASGSGRSVSMVTDHAEQKKDKGNFWKDHP